MHVVASFDYSMYLELALAELEQYGIRRQSILAVPLQVRPARRPAFDTIHQSDGTSYLDIGMAIGSAVSVVTASLGLTLQWGPIVWGLIGAAGGFFIGFVISLLLNRKRMRRTKRRRIVDIFVLVQCTNCEADAVADILWRNQAFGVAFIAGKNESVSLQLKQDGNGIT